MCCNCFGRKYFDSKKINLKMNRDFLQYIKAINGIYFISILIWIIAWFISLGAFDLRTSVIMGLFLMSTQIIILICSLLFFFLTKNILLIKEQINYSLVILIAIIDILFLINFAGIERTTLAFLFSLNTLSLTYILRHKFE